MAAAIPTTLLCGFLGSGKTTRINNLIRAGVLKNALFLVNDFGRVNIDAELIESQEEEIIRLNNGCACCGIAGNLSTQLRDIRGWPQRPERLVFEASGIARPRPLMQLLDAAQGYRLNMSESLVDASAFEYHCSDTRIEDIFTAQIRETDQIRINRLSWLPIEARKAVLQHIATINPSARQVIEDTKPPPPASQPPAGRANSGSLVTHSLPMTRPIDVDTLDILLAEAAPCLLRAKGIVQANDGRGTCYVVQFSGGRTCRTSTLAGKTQALVVIGYRGRMLQTLLGALKSL